MTESRKDLPEQLAETPPIPNAFREAFKPEIRPTTGIPIEKTEKLSPEENVFTKARRFFQRLLPLNSLKNQ